MDLQNIIKLVEAGFTKAEILAMTSGTVVADQSVPEVKTEDQTTPVQAEEIKTAENDNADLLSQLASQVADLRKQMQKQNLQNTFTDTPAKRETPEEILATLINPKRKE